MKKITATFAMLFMLLLVSFEPVASGSATQELMYKQLVSYMKYTNPKIKKWESDRILKMSAIYSNQYKINPFKIIAHMKVESDFRWNVVSKRKNTKIAYGVMQINKHVWVLDKSNEKSLVKIGMVNRIRDLFDIKVNINAGAYIMDDIRKTCTRWADRGKLKKKGYKNVEQCEVMRYNGSMKLDYYNKVMHSYTELTKFLLSNERNFGT